MNQYRHAKISQYIPHGYDETLLYNAAQFADKLGDALAKNGRNATLFVNVAQKTGNVYLQTGDKENKQMIFLNQESLKGKSDGVSGYIAKDNTDSVLREIVKSVSGKQQGYGNNQPNGNYQGNNGYQGNNNSYPQNGYQSNPQYGNPQNQYGNPQNTQYGNSQSLVGISPELNREAPDVKTAERLGEEIGRKLGLQPQQKPQIWVNPDRFGGLSLSLKIGSGTAYFNLNPYSLLNGRGEISKITDRQNVLSDEAKRGLSSEFAVRQHITLAGETSTAIKANDTSILEAVHAFDATAVRIGNIVGNTPEKPFYIGKQDQQPHYSPVVIAAKHRDNSPMIDVTASITDRETTLRIGFSATSVSQNNPAVKYMAIYPKGSEATPALQKIISAIEHNPEITKMESYRYQSMQGTSERITAMPPERTPEGTPEMTQNNSAVRISDMVNQNDNFVMQGIEKMKVLAETLQGNLEDRGIHTAPVVFVGKHGNPPAYVANIEIEDGNSQMKLYVNDSSLKTESSPHVYDFSVYDHARGVQGREELLTPMLKNAVEIMQNGGYFKQTELQRFVEEYNKNPEHKTTTAVYHRAGDVYSDFGRTTQVNTEMAEILSKDGVNKAVPRVYLNAGSGQLDVLVKTPQANIMSRQFTPEIIQRLSDKYLSAESMQAVCQIANVPEPQSKVQDMLKQAEKAGIRTAPTTESRTPSAQPQPSQPQPQPKSDFFADTKVVLSIDNQTFTHKPTGGEIGGIKSRLAQNPPREYSLQEILTASNKGMTVCPAVVAPTLNSKGTPSHNETGWQSQQMFFVDIDNTKETENGNHIPLTKEEGFLSMQDALNLCKENQINVVSMYESFSSTPDFQHFRMTVLLPEPVTNIEEQHRVIQGLTSVFGQAADQVCFNGDRIFFGNAPNQKSYRIAKDEQHLYTSKETLLALYEKNVAPQQHQQSVQYDDEEDYAGSLFDNPNDSLDGFTTIIDPVGYPENPEEDIYTKMEQLEQQGFRGTLQELHQAVGFQGSPEILKEFAENCGFDNMIIEQRINQQDKIAG